MQTESITTTTVTDEPQIALHALVLGYNRPSKLDRPTLGRYLYQRPDGVHIVATRDNAKEIFEAVTVITDLTQLADLTTDYLFIF